MIEKSANPIVRLELEYADGMISRADGVDAAAIWGHFERLLGEMQVSRGRVYSGPKLKVVREGKKEGDACDG